MSDIDGVSLSTFTEVLHKVPRSKEFNAKPALTFDGLEKAGPHVQAYLRARYDDVEWMEILHQLPMKAFARLSFDEVCKIRYSCSFMMDQSVETVFKTDPQYAIVHKIVSSMWRWGVGNDVWNEIVDAYDAIRRFVVPIPGIEVRLDYTRSVNECGTSEYSGTFLDGVFAFLLYHKGEHVMTLGFSIMAGKKVLIQQVQLRNRRGNRWLFKLPENRLEYFVGLFAKAFAHHTLYIADGGDIIGKSLASYRNGLATVKNAITRARKQIAEGSGNIEYYAQDIQRNEENRKLFAEKIAHLEQDLPRLAAFYWDTGRFEQGESLNVNGIVHYKLDSRHIN